LHSAKARGRGSLSAIDRDRQSAAEHGLGAQEREVSRASIAGQNRGSEAQERPAEALAKFTEGFETPDLQAASALLAELGTK
jgi:hypothetical protein